MSKHPTIGDTLEQTVARYPENDAIVYPHRNQTWTYEEFNQRVNQLANSMTRLGVEKGDRVATVLYNGSEIALTVYACAKIGAVFTPLNFRLPAGEIEYIVNDAEATMLIYESATQDAVETARPELDSVEEYVFIDDGVPSETRDFYSLLDSGSPERPDVVVEEDDVYAFIYTSGTTGRPKGVVHEHRDMVEHSLLVIAEMNITRDDVGLSILPLYHCAELHAMLFTRVHRGATNVIHHEFEPQAALEAIEEHGVTVFFAAPTAWHALAQTAAEADVDVGSLERGLYGAAPMPEEVLNMAMEHLCEDYVQAYGMTEIGPCGVFQRPEDQISKQGCAGLPALNHEVRVVEPNAPPDEEVAQGDVGEIIIAGPCTMREYWNRPDATAASLRETGGTEWYYSGDIGYFDDDGYLYHVDRKDDMIVSGGENIYPAEVENVLFAHESVDEAAVLGESDEEWGERVVAYIVGEEEATAETLDEFIRESDQLADFKRPRAYYFVDSLPKNPSGKIQKFKLRSADSGGKSESIGT
ncbi:Acyl-CoA synthetase (AMP-forming)/AMP-acid ligase II [Halovenus aranensis]|jgi:acyl-CoA synthetase (AMP-forming)/AMP-acid ligase II|uniref:Acyl-CoA synthetase (AMP-forming)/AMP-acid ligase II n=1 Tax=Halovenus aranensis TaxID=890420 RepID=A0A1G8VNP7_9EURY|nr:long-chain-fatty-acid--CoA ligase [Halovenus aranensis]SDJ67698.1 Acyl-CoA synthetase (AMP-forming)/AMP-acid ligase II [Halovenus aranensis]